MLSKGISSAVSANNLSPAGFVAPRTKGTKKSFYSGLQTSNRVFHAAYFATRLGAGHYETPTCL